MIVETFNSRLFFALAHVLQVPFIALSSTVLFAHASMAVANPINPAYIPAISSYYSHHMNFWQRLDNVKVHLVTMIGMEFFLNAKAEELKEKYFGKHLPPLREIAKNVSLTLVNSISTLNGPRPLVPGIIEIGGMFLKPGKPIPKDIEKFINESTHGVVYFCMGSLLRGETFPEEKRNAFLRAFARLPQRVLWKWEGDTLPGKPDNIMIAKWMPQRDILAHPNIKLFISHGGLLGTSEAVYEGVPILGIPIFGDQRTNLKSIESNGAGEILDYNEISEEVVYEKITRLLNNPQYKKSAVDLSIRYKDRPMSPLDTAVYWTEYVIRHKGAPHLKTAAVHMPWHEYLLLDVIAFLFVVIVTALIIMYYTLKFTLRFIYNMIFGGKNISQESQKKIKKS